MASILRPRQPAPSRSGGKIVRTRRNPGARTPYDRPGLPANSDSENPNWLSKLIYSPTRMIATGAGKLLSSVFSNDSSSSSSSTSGSGSTSDDGLDDDSDDDDISAHAANIVEKNERQPVVEKSETKRLIEQLLMQENFSREEYDRLTSIIKSRVVDRPSIIGSGEGKLCESPNRIVLQDADTPDRCSAAVLEAKKWLEGKKSGSNSKSVFEFGTCSLNSAMLPPASENETGSPVDMAKSYMQTRPAWASPSANRTDYISPSPSGIQLFKEETPRAFSSTSLSSWKMKRDSPGSWNILDEIRKVRSKASEEMLRTIPSSKIDLSAFTSKRKNAVDSLVAVEIEGGTKDKMECSPNYANASLQLAPGVRTANGLPVSHVAQDGIRNEALSPTPATVAPEQNESMKDADDIRLMEGTEERSLRSGEMHQSLERIQTVLQSDAGALNIDRNVVSDSIRQPLNTTIKGLSEGDQCHSTLKGVAKTSLSHADNGGCPSGSSSSSAGDRQQKSRPSKKEGNEKSSRSIPVDMVCGFLSEASVEVPVTYENNSLPTCSQNSSSIQSDGLSCDLPRPNSKRTLAGKANGGTEKQPVKKVSGYSRRGRGRGKKMPN